MDTAEDIKKARIAWLSARPANCPLTEAEVERLLRSVEAEAAVRHAEIRAEIAVLEMSVARVCAETALLRSIDRAVDGAITNRVLAGDDPRRTN